METNRKPEHGNKRSILLLQFSLLQFEKVCFHAFLNYLWVNSLISSKIKYAHALES